MDDAGKSAEEVVGDRRMVRDSMMGWPTRAGDGEDRMRWSSSGVMDAAGSHIGRWEATVDDLVGKGKIID